MRILGIDPGLRLTGYGCVEPPASGSRLDAPLRLVEAGVIRLSARASVASRLAELDEDLRAILASLRPEAVAVEMLYAHHAHPATAIVMAHARGVILLAVERAGLRLVELRPTEVKKSLVGHGHASKAQMQEGVRAALRLAKRPSPPDVADALAIAMCAAHRAGSGARLDRR